MFKAGTNTVLHNTGHSEVAIHKMKRFKHSTKMFVYEKTILTRDRWTDYFSTRTGRTSYSAIQAFDKKNLPDPGICTLCQTENYRDNCTDSTTHVSQIYANCRKLAFFLKEVKRIVSRT